MSGRGSCCAGARGARGASTSPSFGLGYLTHRVIEATQGAPGLLEFKACREPTRGFLAGFSRWESADAFRAALPTIQSLAPLRKPEWSTRPDELITLVEA